tara:strand:+ start:74 stop:646 length:573 start_codon:yes stop_codon:yes gene_type:complete
MSYNLKDVFYLGATHEYLGATYASAGIEGNIPIDVSAYVDPISKGRQRGQGLAIYKVHSQVSGNELGGGPIGSDVGAATHGLSVKPFTTSGDNSQALTGDDMSPSSDLAIYLANFVQPASNAMGVQVRNVTLEPSTEVPYVVVRDTIFQTFVTSIAAASGDNMHVSYRMECAMISLDTATLNQLLRTQTA